MEREQFMRKTLLLLASLFVWALHFLVVYPFNALACVRGWSDASLAGFGLVPVVVIAATGCAIAASIVILMLGLFRLGPAACLRRGASPDDFIGALTVGLAALVAVAIAWNGLPALMVPPCG
jgi:hypothetical protein